MVSSWNMFVAERRKSGIEIADLAGKWKYMNTNDRAPYVELAITANQGNTNKKGKSSRGISKSKRIIKQPYADVVQPKKGTRIWVQFKDAKYKGTVGKLYNRGTKVMFEDGDLETFNFMSMKKGIDWNETMQTNTTAIDHVNVSEDANLVLNLQHGFENKYANINDTSTEVLMDIISAEDVGNARKNNIVNAVFSQLSISDSIALKQTLCKHVPEQYAPMIIFA